MTHALNDTFQTYMKKKIKSNMDRINKNQVLTDKKGFPLEIMDYSIESLFEEYQEHKTEARRLLEQQSTLPFSNIKQQESKTSHKKRPTN